MNEAHKLKKYQRAYQKWEERREQAHAHAVAFLGTLGFPMSGSMEECYEHFVSDKWRTPGCEEFFKNSMNYNFNATSFDELKWWVVDEYRHKLNCFWRVEKADFGIE